MARGRVRAREGDTVLEGAAGTGVDGRLQDAKKDKRERIWCNGSMKQTLFRPIYVRTHIAYTNYITGTDIRGGVNERDGASGRWNYKCHAERLERKRRRACGAGKASTMCARGLPRQRTQCSAAEARYTIPPSMGEMYSANMKAAPRPRLPFHNSVEKREIEEQQKEATPIKLRQAAPEIIGGACKGGYDNAC
ncbi:hypothetical protein C8F04DRAFT_1194165 [Mycena alexandri]|uniref:Uncharacterized protein n=1 Tax=Mycena alexandri TaxID=1745969 RepID=A0AAD6SC51_9AGAR|nr:hypothetical protein C8F04DRAFT_1194165 [Mycena alexandri]